MTLIKEQASDVESKQTINLTPAATVLNSKMQHTANLKSMTGAKTSEELMTHQQNLIMHDEIHKLDEPKVLISKQHYNSQKSSTPYSDHRPTNQLAERMQIDIHKASMSSAVQSNIGANLKQTPSPASPLS